MTKSLETLTSARTSRAAPSQLKRTIWLQHKNPYQPYQPRYFILQSNFINSIHSSRNKIRWKISLFVPLVSGIILFNLEDHESVPRTHLHHSGYCPGLKKYLPWVSPVVCVFPYILVIFILHRFLLALPSKNKAGKQAYFNHYYVEVSYRIVAVGNKIHYYHY